MARIDDPREELKIERLPVSIRDRCRIALEIREGLLADDPRLVYAAPVENPEYKAGGIVLRRLGERAVEFLSPRILHGDLRAIRLAGWTVLPSLIQALEARLACESTAWLQFHIRKSLDRLRRRP